jgi:hypothetical protein
MRQQHGRLVRVVVSSKMKWTRAAFGLGAAAGLAIEGWARGDESVASSLFSRLLSVTDTA